MNRPKKLTRFLVTRKFTAGFLKDLTHTGDTTVEFKIGFHCKRPAGGSPYVITAVERIE